MYPLSSGWWLLLCPRTGAWTTAVLDFAWMSVSVRGVRETKKDEEKDQPSSQTRSVYILPVGCAPVPGQFWTIRDSVAKQLGNVS